MSEEINMKENSATEQTAEAEQEKKFTQADLDRIVGERLKRVRADQRAAASEEQAAQAATLTQRENDLSSRESRLTCREYLLDKAYPAELLDVIDTSDPQAFREKADKVFGIMQTQVQSAMPTMPLASLEAPVGEDPITQAFAPDAKHKPKQWPPRMDEQ